MRFDRQLCALDVYNGTVMSSSPFHVAFRIGNEPHNKEVFPGVPFVIDFVAIVSGGPPPRLEYAAFEGIPAVFV